MAIIASSYLDELPNKQTRTPRNPSRTGYGRKIPTRHMVQLPGSDVWRRVYCCIFSNSGTCYVPVKGGWHVIN